MAFTKMHNWNPDPSADGPVPASSERCAGLQEVRMSDADGEWFGYETPGGALVPCVRVTNSPAKQAEIDALQVVITNRSGVLETLFSDMDAVRTKLTNGDPLTDADRDLIADLVLGRY